MSSQTIQKSSKGQLRPPSLRMAPGRRRNIGNSGQMGNSRKQAHPQSLGHKSGDEDGDYSGLSDSDDENMGTNNILFRNVAASRLAGSDTQKCDWCKGRPVNAELLLMTANRTSKIFCSETCQDLFKEASLKNKVCEWCERQHVSGSQLVVSEPSIQSLPLQFCNTACLNRYKMKVFCDEVTEQLLHIERDNIQLQVSKPGSGCKKERKLLITPELWDEGDAAITFVTADSNNNGDSAPGHGVYSSSERKRKCHSVETVISKLSKQANHHSSMTNIEHTNGKDGLLSGDEPKNANDPESTSPMVRSTRTELYNQHEIKTSDTLKPANQVPANPDFSKMIPLPFFIPIPVPIPIPMGVLHKREDISTNSETRVAAIGGRLNGTERQVAADKRHQGVYISQRLFKAALAKSKTAAGYKQEDPE